MQTLRNRVRELHGKYGTWGLAWRILTDPFRVLRQLWQSMFRNYNYIFVYEPTAPRVPVPQGFSMQRFGQVEEVPAALLQQLQGVLGEEEARMNLIAVKHCGCVLWVALIDGEPAGVALSRRGEFIPYWFTPLGCNDLVLFRVYTASPHRGKGISPALSQSLLRRELVEGASAYWDCKVYNKPSIRAAQKVGFRIIAEMRPLPPEPWPGML